MRTVKILGAGCTKCKQTEAVVREAMEKFGIEADVQKIEDIQQIIQYNVLSTPAVVVDEVVKLKGRVPTINEIKEVLS